MQNHSASDRLHAKPTIYDVARIAGTSGSTVSRYLNGHPYVRAETAQRIASAIDSLQFERNTTARSLKTSRTHQVMLAIPDMDNPFYFEMVKSFHRVVEKNGCLMVIAYTEGIPEGERRVLQRMRQGQLEGLAMVSLSDGSLPVDFVRYGYFPLCAIWMSAVKAIDDGLQADRVFVDTRRGIRMAVESLIEKGHRRIGIAAGLDGVHPFRERLEGYRDAIRAAGIPDSEELVFFSPYTEEEGRVAGRHFAQLNPRPTAVIAANDILALGILDSFRSLDISVPERISVVGMDAMSVGRHLPVPLTSVSLSEAEIGEKAAELLFERVSAWRRREIPEPGVAEFEPRLIERASVASLRTQ